MFFFAAKDGTQMYMGKDKFENEDLIKYGWPEDVWFHVDNLSSAHVYVRLGPGQTMADIPDEVVRDCAQLVKENSIEGCKKATVTVIYTPWANLRKDGSMATGQVSFHNPANVKKYIVMERDKETLRRLEKSRDERHPDLAAERAQRDTEEKAKWKAEGRAKAKAEQELREERCGARARRGRGRAGGRPTAWGRATPTRVPQLRSPPLPLRAARALRFTRLPRGCALRGSVRACRQRDKQARSYDTLFKPKEAAAAGRGGGKKKLGEGRGGALRGVV